MTKASVTMTVKKGVTVVRDGKRIRPELNKTFDFTADERDAILKVDAAALAKPTGAEESGDAEAASTTATGGKKSSAESSQAAAKGGKKKATANTSDAESESEGEGEGEGEAAADDDL